MAHFAEINDSNIVQRVIVVSNSNASNEAAGIAFCKALLGSDTNWVQTSYNDNIRCRFASIGMKYDATNDVFYKQKPYPSWTLNTSTWEWEAPVALPDDAVDNDTHFVGYTWDEDTRSWTNRTVLDLS
jgi:hypothetical protein|tara:strand:- start:72 stop:455 length:384 start_codon:yes stop_codon:yes gene_type:complete